MNLELYADSIRELDPDEEIVSIDIENEDISYSDEIQSDRTPKFEPEEFSRAFIVTWLCTKGGYSKRNIYLEKKYTLGRPGGTSAYGDILVRRYDDGEVTPYMVIEVKSPSDYNEDDNEVIKGQLFDIAHQEPGVSVLSLAVAKEQEENVNITTLTIDYSRHPNFEAWIDEGKPATGKLPPHFGKVIPKPLIKGGEHDLREDVSLDEFDTIWRRLHNLLWGGHLDDNTAFKWVVYLLLTKIYDEKNKTKGEEYEFQIKYRGGEIEDKSSSYARINKLYKDAVIRYLKPNRSHRDIPDLGGDEFGGSRVRNVVEQLQEISITESSKNHSGDLLGRFFEQIIREGFKQSKGLFLTHPNIVYFMLEAVDLKGLAKEKLQTNTGIDERIPYIIDPACGSGTFLLGTLRMIEDYIKENKDDLAETSDIKDAIEGLFGPGSTWAHTHIYGLDPHNSLPIAAKVNMILHGDGAGHIYQESALLPLSKYTNIDDQRRLEPTSDKSDPNYDFPVSETFDLLVTNPPFSISLSDEDKRTLSNSFKFAQEEVSENLFLERWYQLLKPRGRLAAVLPESFFNVGENSYIRRFLMKYFNIKAIVSLPEVTFEPHTTTLTSLLFAQKKSREEVNKWKKIWKEKEVEFKNEIKALLKGLYKKNWPKEENSRKRWIENRIEEMDYILEGPEAEELKKLGEIEEVVKKLRYKLNRAKGADKEGFVLVRVCDALDYQFPVITVENVGYKRTKRSTRLKPNELFKATNDKENGLKNIESIEADFTVVENLDSPETALDVIRKEVKWE